MTRSMQALGLLAALAAPAAAAGQVNPRDAKAARKLHDDGQKALRNERFEEAAVKFRGAIQLDPGLVVAHYGLGKAQMALKRYEQAVDTLEGCKSLILRASAGDLKARAELDRLRRDAIRDLEQSLNQIQSGRVKGGARALEVQIEQRLMELRQADMRGAEQQVKVPAEMSLLLGSAYFRQQRLPEAETNYKAAIGTDPKLGEAHNNLAVIYMLTGRLDDSRREIEAAEKAGFRVSPQFKKDLEARAAAAVN